MKRKAADPRAWEARARALEGEGRLGEAETLIRNSIPDPRFALAIAELYVYRRDRLTAAGDAAGAGAALDEAERWAYFFASQATSGGEGLAFVAERDAFLRRIGRPPGRE